MRLEPVDDRKCILQKQGWCKMAQFPSRITKRHTQARASKPYSRAPNIIQKFKDAVANTWNWIAGSKEAGEAEEMSRHETVILPSRKAVASTSKLFDKEKQADLAFVENIVENSLQIKPPIAPKPKKTVDISSNTIISSERKVIYCFNHLEYAKNDLF